MRILVIAHAFPPYPASGALRPGNVVAALRRRGHAVHVITSRLRGEPAGARVREPDLTVLPVRYPPNPRYLYVAAKAALRHVCRSGADPSLNRTSFPESMPDSIPTWKRYLLSLLYLPDTQQGFIPAAVARSLPIVHHGIDLLYTTGPVFSTHIAGLLLKQMTGVRWAAEFRDLWTQDPSREHTGHLRSRASVAIETWLESRFLRSADHIVSVSAGIQRQLMQRVETRFHGNFILARNGIVQLESQAVISSPKTPLRVLYLGGLGSIGLPRDPRPFLSVLATLRKETEPSLREITLDLVGGCDWYQDIEMRPFVRSLGLSDVVRVHSWVPHEAGQEMLRHADLLLLLAQGQPDAVPNKLYEYLGTRKPILAFADDAGETASMLRTAGGHHLITEHDPPAAIKRAVLTVLRERADGVVTQGDGAILREWTTERQMEHLMTALCL